MKLLKHLYLSEDLHLQAAQITEELKSGRYTSNVYLITCDCERGGQLEMIHNQLLRQSVLRERIPLIIGMASSKDAGVEMIGAIITSVLDQTGSMDYKTFFSKQEQITTRG